MSTRKKGREIKSCFKPIIVDGMKGFTLSNIQKSLRPQQFAQFRSWLIGQTVGVYKNETFIYEHDFERFLADLPPLD